MTPTSPASCVLLCFNTETALNIREWHNACLVASNTPILDRLESHVPCLLFVMMHDVQQLLKLIARLQRDDR